MNKEITIRRATQNDREILCDIQHSAIVVLGRSHYSESELEAWSNGLSPERYEKMIDQDYVVVAEKDNQVIAYGRLEYNGEVAAVYVFPEYVRQGIGSAILSELLSQARQFGLRSVYCKSSLSAEIFYSKAGFQSGHRCKYRFRDGREIECVPMTKILD